MKKYSTEQENIDAWRKAGGLFCNECPNFKEKSIFSFTNYCTKHGWVMNMREGVLMTGCNNHGYDM